jgi:hypothetical protein
MMTPRPTSDTTDNIALSTNSDEQLQDFIEGRDALSQQLKALKNHPDQGVPAALDAAILANIESALAQEANTAHSTHLNKSRQKQTPSLFTLLDFLFKHWAIPVSVTALLILGLTLQLREQDQEKTSVLLAENKVQIPAEIVFTPAPLSHAEQVAPTMKMERPLASNAPETTPSLQASRKTIKSSDLIAEKAKRASVPTIMVKPESQAIPEPQIASATLVQNLNQSEVSSDAKLTVAVTGSRVSNSNMVSSTVQEQSASHSLITDAPISSNPHASTAAISSKTMGLNGSLKRTQEQTLAAASLSEFTLEKNKPLPIPTTTKSALPAISIKPIIEEEISWLKRIEEQLKQEKNETALKEWQAFRKAYPHVQINERTLKQLQVLEQSKREP